ncbi:hypothetical protein BFGS084_02366 [Bacteroides fragilis]|nr:hypothetical protein BFGS084_02366 [Bacteroides fragilis]
MCFENIKLSPIGTVGGKWKEKRKRVSRKEADIQRYTICFLSPKRLI